MYKDIQMFRPSIEVNLIPIISKTLKVSYTGETCSFYFIVLRVVSDNTVYSYHFPLKIVM